MNDDLIILSDNKVDEVKKVGDTLELAGTLIYEGTWNSLYYGQSWFESLELPKVATLTFNHGKGWEHDIGVFIDMQVVEGNRVEYKAVVDDKDAVKKIHTRIKTLEKLGIGPEHAVGISAELYTKKVNNKKLKRMEAEKGRIMRGSLVVDPACPKGICTVHPQLSKDECVHELAHEVGTMLGVGPNGEWLDKCTEHVKNTMPDYTEDEIGAVCNYIYYDVPNGRGYEFNGKGPCSDLIELAKEEAEELVSSCEKKYSVGTTPSGAKRAQRYRKGLSGCVEAKRACRGLSEKNAKALCKWIYFRRHSMEEKDIEKLMEDYEGAKDKDKFIKNIEESMEVEINKELDKLAEYPWKKCIKEQSAKHGKERAGKICAAIKMKTIKHSIEYDYAATVEDAIEYVADRIDEDKLFAYQLEKWAEKYCECDDMVEEDKEKLQDPEKKDECPEGKVYDKKSGDCVKKPKEEKYTKDEQPTEALVAKTQKPDEPDIEVTIKNEDEKSSSDAEMEKLKEELKFVREGIVTEIGEILGEDVSETYKDMTSQELVKVKEQFKKLATKGKVGIRHSAPNFSTGSTDKGDEDTFGVKMG